MTYMKESLVEEVVYKLTWPSQYLTDCKTPEDEYMALVAICQEAASLLRKASKLLSAVDVSEFDGISCRGVDGTNWFDARGLILDKREMEE